MTTTTKRLAVTAATAATMMGSLALPAMAQEQQQYGTTQYAPQGQAQQQAPQGRAVAVTGVIQRLPSDGGPAPYGLTDEASGVLYVLDGGQGGFSAYEGRRVTVTGTARDTGASYESLSVSDVKAARDAGGTTGNAQDATATLSFEVKTDCAPPRGTTLLGFVPAEGRISAPLSDPDGDGVYTGSVDVPRFAPGPTPAGTEPVSVPVRIAKDVGDGSGNVETIKDFGQVKLDGDEAFSVSASFCRSAAGAGSGQYGQEEKQAAPETTAPAAAASGNTVRGAEQTTGNAADAAVVSGDTSNANQGVPAAPANTGDGSASASAGGAAAKASSATSGPAGGFASSAANVLPGTGGLSLPVAGAGALLLAGGLLVRGIFR